MRRVVVTGVGAVSPLGHNAVETWEGMKAGRNGIAPMTSIDTSDMPVKVAGEVKDFRATDYLETKEARRMDRYCQYAVIAGNEAIADADFGDSRPDPYRFGVIIGSGIGGLQTAQDEVTKLNEKGFRKTNPLFIPMMISNMGSGMLAIRHDLRGHNTSVATACATGSHAIGDAFRLIRHGYADAMLAGGAEGALTRLSLSGFSGLKALTNSDDPDRASIPFDAERSGFVIGEGAGVLVLEDYEHAKARGARIYGEILGYGATADAYHMTAPRPDGAGNIAAMQQALADSGLRPEQIMYINAHGTSTPLNDKAETSAVHAVFGDHARNMAMSSVKSMTGHLLGAAGAVEAIASLMTIRDGFLPPTINYRVPDPECDIDCVPNEGRHADVDYVLSNSLAFGGHNAALIFGRVED